MRPKKRLKASPRGRRTRAKNLALAVFFLLLFLIGVLVPVLPQVPFLILGLIFLSLVSRRVRRAIRGFLHRHPKLDHLYKRWRNAARRKRREHILREKDLES